MIKAVFNQINSLSDSDKDTLIIQGDIHQAPAVGNVINIKGYPYVVHDVAWAFTEWHYELVQHCYVRCLPRPAAQK